MEDALSSSVAPTVAIVGPDNNGIVVGEEKRITSVQTLEKELVDDIFQRNDDLQKNLMHGIAVQQKSFIKTVQKRTFKTLEDWKKEMDFRISSMEKRLGVSIGRNSHQNQQQNSHKRVRLSFLQFIGLIFVCFFLARNL